MKRLFFIAFVWICLPVFGQENGTNIITGKVLDSISAIPLEYVTVTLFLKGHNKPINGGTTDKKGTFHITDVSDSVFNIVFEYIGYNSFTLYNIQVNKKNNPLHLNTVLLNRKTGLLQGVTIVAQGKVIENRIDKMIFNAERDISSQSGVATDVLKKVPQVSVDIDGNVQLAGSSGIRFLINGKPSTAFGSSIADVLQSIPASQIKSIEVITNPGAKYDAAGIGGIINIILKTNNAKGYNGSISLTTSTLQENGSLNLNMRKGTFGMNAFLSGNARLRSATPYNSERVSIDANNQQTILHQEGTGRFIRSGYQTGFGFDWTPQKQNNFSGALSFNKFFNNGDSRDMQTITRSSGSQIISEIKNDNNVRFHNVDIDLNYKRTFKKEDQELEININSSFDNNTSAGSSSQFLLPQDSMYYGTNSNNPGSEKETEITMDFTTPVKEDIIFGIGGKVSFYDINSTSEVMRYQPVIKQYVPNSSLSNNLNYNQKIYALYSEITFPMGKLLEAKFGGRYERTEINSFYSNAVQQVKVPGYNTLVPSIYLLRRIGEDQTLKISYSKRIERPEYNDLNPFINTNDPNNLSAGNAFLKPETGNRIELSYSNDVENTGTFMASIFYRINYRDIQPYIIFYPSFKAGDSVYTNVSVRTRQNIGTEKNAGISLFADMHMSSTFSLRSNVFFFYRHTINQVDPGFNTNSFNYRFNLNATWQVTPTFAGEFFGNFNSARHEAQGIYPSFTSYNIALRKQFWNKKGSLALSATNLFSKYVEQKTKLFGPNFTSTNTRYIPFRSFGLNFSWKFGKLEFKKEREEGDNNLTAPLD